MNTLIRYPNTIEALEDYNLRMQAKDSEALLKVLPDDDVKKLSIIWEKIRELTPKWLEKKRDGIRAPSYPLNRKDYWTEFAEKICPSPFIELDRFIRKTGLVTGKVAMDIGCSNSLITQELLKNGWKVIALDKCSKALEILKINNSQHSDQLTTICQCITKYIPQDPVDLVICKDIFAYVNPSKFQAVWEKIYSLFLKNNGFFFGSFFAESQDPSKVIITNRLKEIGAWFIPDRRMLLPMLEETGYKLEETEISVHQQLKNDQRIIFQFSAQKIKGNL